MPVMFLFFIINPGCKKTLDNRIVGTWSVVHVDDLSNKDIVEWVFTNNNEVYFSTLPSSGPITNKDTGQYITNTSLGKRYVEIVECRQNTNNNKKYRIMKLNKKVMKLIVESKHGLDFIEFTKVR
jgi:hypothetical protein